MTSFMTRILPGAALAALLFPRPAEACSGIDCSVPLMPRPDATVPANVAGFPLTLPPPGGYFDAGVASAVLKDGAGRVIPTVLKRLDDAPGFDQLLAPTEPLQQGPHVVEIAFDCFGEAQTQRRTFDVGPEATLPLETGSLRSTVTSSSTVLVAASGGACAAALPATKATIEIDRAPALAPFDAAVVYAVRADGAAWEGPRGGPYRFSARDPFTVYTACGRSEDPSASLSERGVRAGRHTVEVQAILPGAATQPAPATIEIELACAGAGDAGTGDAESDAAAGADSSSSCAVRSAPLHAGSVAALIVASALALRRRRQRRGT